MVRVRLRTKFLLSMVLITAGLTSVSLLLVRRNVQSQVTKEIFSDLQNSVGTFQSFQREKEVMLNHSADLLADMPALRAMMTTHDEATIQDGSGPLAKLAGSDVFVLADASGKIVALHTNKPGFTRQMAQQSFTGALTQEQVWWMGAQHLYQVFMRPIYFGPALKDSVLGFVVVGYEIDDRVASQIGRIANSKVIFYYGDTIITSTLSRSLDSELTRQTFSGTRTQPQLLKLGDERFLETTIDLAPESKSEVQLTVLKSYDQATQPLQKLNRLLLGVGLLAILIGSGLVYLISDTFTRPLSSLLAGVAALERGDFTYALETDGGDEAAELSRAFDRMRQSLQRIQQNLLESERLATIGRMASSISHDLRHSLAAIVANAEFLCEQNLSREQREELYQEVQLAVQRMTELIDSLLEFSRTRASLRPTHGSVRGDVENALHALRSSPEFHNANVEIRQSGTVEGWFDHRKLERVFFNLFLNACEATPDRTGRVIVELRDASGSIEIKVVDHGRGIPASIRNTLFEPFISLGKENGTGLGLTVVQKIVQDHGGEVAVERTSSEGTIFRITLPYPVAPVRSDGPDSSDQPSSAAGVHASSAKQA
jgi:signal transduction histidine kinase